jgi:hypothetical protein
MILLLRELQVISVLAKWKESEREREREREREILGPMPDECVGNN